LLEVVNYNHTNTPYSLSIQLLEKINLSEDLESSNREVLFIEDICKRIQKSKSVLYVLKNEDDIIGLIALSFTSVKEQPSLQIDYVIVDKKYQGKELKVLDNCKPFRYLMKLAVVLAKRISQEIGLRYIVLSPDNDDLENKYKQVNFQKLNDNWMYLKIQNS